MAVTSALNSVYEMKIPAGHWISACFILFLFFASYLIVNIVYAQQGGAATGGSATSGSNVAGPANCYGTCNFYGGPATGGPATGGNALGSGGGRQGSQSQIPNNLNNNPNHSSDNSDINRLIQKAYTLIVLGKPNEAITYYDKVLAIDPNDQAALINKNLDIQKLNNG